MRSRTLRIAAAAAVIAGTIGGTAAMASATPGTPDHTVTICHATASKTNPYVMITVDVASIVGDSGHGNSGVNAGDIIPQFTNVGGYSYPGHNLQLLGTPGGAGCGLPVPPCNDGGDTPTNPPSDSF